MRLPPNHANFKVHRERDFSALWRLAILLSFGLALTGGFLFAARQHFAAIQYGYKTEELRREHERLLAEQRRLLLAREEASSPARLEPAARAIGLRPVMPGQIASRKPAQPEQQDQPEQQGQRESSPPATAADRATSRHRGK